MADDSSKQLLGELLTEAGLLQVDDLREALNIARSQRLQIGKVLVMSGYISKELLEATVEMQSRLKDNTLNYDTGIKAIKLVESDKISLEVALSRLGVGARSPDSTSNRLGALLLDADLLTKNDFDNALVESTRCGLPLGRVLSNLSLISDRIVNIALQAQRMLRTGQISKAEAVKTLVEIKEGKISQENLVITGANAIVDNNKNPRVQNIPVQEQSKTNETVTVEKNPVSSNLEFLSLHHILRIAGLIQTDQLEKAIKESLENPDVMGLILKRSGVLEDFVIDAAKECCQLIAAGVLKPEQAIMALHQCQRTRSPLKDCLEEYGWIEKSKITL